jgi:hypothetical protein
MVQQIAQYTATLTGTRLAKRPAMTSWLTSGSTVARHTHSVPTVPTATDSWRSWHGRCRR